LSVRKKKEMTTAQAIRQSDRYFVVQLKAKPAEELRRFLRGPWTASLFSPEEIEELYQELQERAEKDREEVGQD
jgi:hypothetical protein